ncbi:hypothetical protein B0H12DRAFT_1149825, partial [Mycena haematopus]
GGWAGTTVPVGTAGRRLRASQVVPLASLVLDLVRRDRSVPLGGCGGEWGLRVFGTVWACYFG